MPTRLLKQYLEQANVQYQVIPHDPATTAEGAARAANILAKHVAKAVVLKMNGGFALAVLPASDKLNLDHLKQALGTQDLTIASEDEFAPKFQDCQIGAVPPFGNLYGMHVYVSQHLREDEDIALISGRHDELIEMKYSEFERLVNPTLIHF